jgi:hypothetical protein
MGHGLARQRKTTQSETEFKEHAPPACDNKSRSPPAMVMGFRSDCSTPQAATTDAPLLSIIAEEWLPLWSCLTWLDLLSSVGAVRESGAGGRRRSLSSTSDSG